MRITENMRDYCCKALLLVLLVSLAACSPQVKQSNVSASSKPVANLSLSFQIMHQGERLRCKQGSLGFFNEQGRVVIETFAFYLHQLSLDIKSTEVNSRFEALMPENNWQSNDLGLVVASTLCGDKNEKTTDKQAFNHSIYAHLSEQASKLVVDRSKTEFKEQLKQLRLNFTLGVPFESNHANPLKQISPLNISSMFWSWQMGYKFMRIDLSAPDDKFSFHLGSVGCQSASRVRAPEMECENANRVPISIDIQPEVLKVNQNIIHIDIAIQLDKLLYDLAIKRTNACMFSGIDQVVQCQKLLNALSNKEVFKAI